MSNTSEHLEINPNAFLLHQHIGLLEAAARGVSDVMRVQGRNPDVVVNSIENEAQGNSGLEFILQDCQGSEKIDAREYLGWLELKQQFSDQRANRIIALTSHELTSENYENIVGATLPDMRISVLSLARVIKSCANYGAQVNIARHLARRQYSMLDGLPFDHEVDGTEGALKIYHSGDSCTSKPIVGISEALQSVESLFNVETAGFCAICVAKLRQR